MDIRIVAYNLGENNALFACLGFVFCNGFCVIVQNSCTIDILQLELVLVAFFREPVIYVLAEFVR